LSYDEHAKMAEFTEHENQQENEFDLQSEQEDTQQQFRGMQSSLGLGGGFGIDYSPWTQMRKVSRSQICTEKVHVTIVLLKYSQLA
jgi:hypothetical protein